MLARIIRWLMIALISLVVGLLGLVFVFQLALHHQLSIDYAVSYLESQFPELDIDNATGSFADGLQIEAVTWRDDVTAIALGRINLKLDVDCVWQVRLCVKQLLVDNLVVDSQNPESHGAPPLTPGELPSVISPVPLVVDQVAIERFTLRSHESELQLVAIKGQLEWLLDRIRWQGLSVRYDAGDEADNYRIVASGRIQLAAPYPIKSLLTVQTATAIGTTGAQLAGDMAELVLLGKTTGDVKLKYSATVQPLADSTPWRLQAKLDRYDMATEMGALRFNDIVADISGRGERTVLMAEASVGAEKVQGTHRARLKASLQDEQLIIENLNLGLAEGGLSASGTLGLGHERQGPYKLLLGIRAKQVPLRLFYQDLNGDFDSRAAIKATLNAQQDGLKPESFELLFESLSGTLFEQALAGSGLVNWHAETGLTANKVILAQGKNRILLREPWGGSAPLPLRIDLQQLEGFSALVGGQLAGSLTGELDVDLFADTPIPLMAGKLRLKRFNYNDLNIATASVLVSNSEQVAMAVALDTAVIEYQELLLDSLHMKLTADSSLLGAVNVQAKSKQYGAIQAGCNKTNWQEVQQGKLILSCDSINWLPAAALPFKGELNGRLQATIAKGQLVEFGALLNGDDNQLVWRMNEKPLAVPLRTINVKVAGGLQEAVVDLTVDADQFGGAEGAIKLDKLKTLQGEIAIKQLQLTALQPFLVDLSELQGVANAALQIGGTADKPSVQGSLNIMDANFVHLDFPKAFTGVRATAEFSDYQAGFNGAMQVGDAPASFTGKVEWKGSTPSGNLSIKTDAIEMTPLPQTDIWIASDLDVSWRQRRLSITGQLDVPRAFINLKSLPKDTVNVSNDVVIVDHDDALQDQQPLYANLDVAIGKDVLFRGYGLTTNLKGNMRLTYSPEQLWQGNGVVQLVDGRYRAYGQNLNIRSGELIFVGPLTNPTIHVDAVRDDIADAVTVGIRAEGQLQSPTVSLFSQPAMSDRSKLHYLITGQAPGEGSGDTNSMLSQAAIGLGAATGETFLQDYADKLGIRNFQVTASEGDAGAEVQLSGYINPKLYVSYGMGVFENVNALTMRYKLRKNLFLEAVSSTANTLDLLWSFQVGKANSQD